MGIRTTLLTLAAAAAIAAPAMADVVKVGVIGPFSGPFALYGKNFKLGIDAYAAANGKSVGSHEVQFVYRDLEQADPAKAKALAQELIVKERVQYLAGVYFTPDAMAIAPVLEEGKVPLEESVAIYERGEALKKHCEKLLTAAENRIEKIRLDRAGNPAGVEPLDAD